MSTIVVTGGSGFIGTNLVEHYAAKGAHRIVNLDIHSPRNPEHRAFWESVDLLDRKKLRRAVEEANPTLVFHCGARTDLDGMSVNDYQANIEGVANLVEALKALKSLRLAVFASSMLVCRIGYRPRTEEDFCPSTPYGESKVAGERIVRERVGSAYPWVIVRPTSIWGPWFGSPYGDFFAAVRRGLYFHPRGRKIWRSYGFVLNSVLQLARLAENGGGSLVGRAVYLADYEPIELKWWADCIRRQGGQGRTREVPVGILRLAALVGDGLRVLGYSKPPMTSFRLKNLLTDAIQDLTLLRSECGGMPYTPSDGVRITCDWIDGQSR